MFRFSSVGNQRVSVSSLLVCHGLLLVGTNLGVTVALSVPRLQGIPKVTGNTETSLLHIFKCTSHNVLDHRITESHLVHKVSASPDQRC